MGNNMCSKVVGNNLLGALEGITGTPYFFNIKAKHIEWHHTSR